MLKTVPSLLHQTYNILAYNLGLINTTFFNEQITIAQVERVDANAIPDINGEYVKITTSANHGIDSSDFGVNQLITVRGIKHEYEISNVEINNNTIVFTLPSNKPHNITQENIMDLEFIGFNNPLLLNKSFIVQGISADNQSITKLEFYITYNQQTYFTPQEIADLSGTNRKIRILAFSSNSSKAPELKYVNRTLAKNELMHVTPNSFVYQATIIQRNLTTNYYTQSLQHSQVVYGLSLSLDSSLQHYMDRTSITRDTDIAQIINRNLILIDRGRQTSANVAQPYGENALNSKKNVVHSVDLIVFIKRSNQQDYVSNNIQEVYNICHDVMTILGNYNRLTDNALEFTTLSSPFDASEITPLDNEAGEFSVIGTWYRMTILVNGKSQWNKFKIRENSFGYDGIGVTATTKDSGGIINVTQMVGT